MNRTEGDGEGECGQKRRTFGRKKDARGEKIGEGAISEDQSILGKSLIFVGLAEGVALYGLIISFMILGQL